MCSWPICTLLNHLSTIMCFGSVEGTIWSKNFNPQFGFYMFLIWFEVLRFMFKSLSMCVKCWIVQNFIVEHELESVFQVGAKLKIAEISAINAESTDPSSDPYGSKASDPLLQSEKTSCHGSELGSTSAIRNFFFSSLLQLTHALTPKTHTTH